MSKSVNKAILVGNVGKDPEVRYSASGIPLAKFSIATNEKYKDRSGDWQERTEWHNVIAWQHLAEIVGEYVKKGGYDSESYEHETADPVDHDLSELQEAFEALVPFDYEDGCGGFGDVVLDVQSGTITITRNDRFEDYTTHSYEV